MAIGGRFIPTNPQKYAGNPGNIIFRSTWELAVMKMFDSNPNVLKWASEEIKIPYISPLDNLVHNYYPDFFVIYTDKYGGLQKEIVEVKPRAESLKEHAKTDAAKVALLVNDAKWKFAAAWAKQRGMTFRVITEHSIFRQKTPKPKIAKTPTGGRKPSGTRGTKK